MLALLLWPLAAAQFRRICRSVCRGFLGAESVAGRRSVSQTPAAATAVPIHVLFGTRAVGCYPREAVTRPRSTSCSWPLARWTI
jgi:hypothetical protein